MIKLMDIIREVKMINYSRPEPNKFYFEYFVREYYKILRDLKPTIKICYSHEQFHGLGEEIINAFGPLAPYFKVFGNRWEAFVEWIQEIDVEKLPIGSSGSFWTALQDTEWVYGEDNEWMDDEESAELANEARNILNGYT